MEQCDRHVLVVARAAGGEGLDQNFRRGLFQTTGGSLQAVCRDPARDNVCMAKLPKADNRIGEHPTGV